MKEYVIVSDSCVDLTQEMANELDLTIIPLSVFSRKSSLS
jgi:fatty acid-binding protein DegV